MSIANKNSNQDILSMQTTKTCATVKYVWILLKPNYIMQVCEHTYHTKESVSGINPAWELNIENVSGPAVPWISTQSNGKQNPRNGVQIKCISMIIWLKNN